MANSKNATFTDWNETGYKTTLVLTVVLWVGGGIRDAPWSRSKCKYTVTSVSNTTIFNSYSPFQKVYFKPN